MAQRIRTLAAQIGRPEFRSPAAHTEDGSWEAGVVAEKELLELAGCC